MGASLVIAAALALPSMVPGEWTAGPMSVELRRVAEAPDLLTVRGDLALTDGVASSVVANPDRRALVLSRSFQRAVAPKGRNALVLIAQGDVGPTRVVVTSYDRRWEHDLVLDATWRRFEIPLRDARPISSLAIESALPAIETSSITIGFVGLGSLGPRIQRIVPTKTGARVFLFGPARSDRQLHAATDASVSTFDVTSSTIDIGDPIASKLWLCHRHERATVCDPPDAPHTFHQRPPRPNEPLVIHDFDSSAQVTAQRQPVKRVASSDARARSMTWNQTAGALELGVPNAPPSDWGGIELPLPALPKHVNTLDLRVRGDIDPGAVSISLFDRAGEIARLELKTYAPELGSDWRMVSIPLSDFADPTIGRKHGAPKALAIILSGRDRAESLQIDQIRFGYDPDAVADSASADLGTRAE